jgi:hypothetical protein
MLCSHLSSVSAPPPAPRALLIFPARPFSERKGQWAFIREHRPKFAKLRPHFENLWTQFHRLWTFFGKLRLTPLKLRPHFAKLREISTRSCPQSAQLCPHLGKLRGKFPQLRPQSGNLWPQFSKMRPQFSKLRRFPRPPPPQKSPQPINPQRFSRFAPKNCPRTTLKIRPPALKPPAPQTRATPPLKPQPQPNQ